MATVCWVLVTLSLFTFAFAQEGGLLYHAFKTYKSDQLPYSVSDQEQQSGYQKYAKYMTFDQTAHGDPEIAVLNGHTQGWSEYLTGLYNIQSIEFLSAGSYPKAY